MHLLYFITAHGYGHGVRACAIANRIAPDIKITFRTTLPERFFQEELTRQFCCYPGEFDCGCLQPDSVTVDRGATLSSYSRIAVRNRTLLASEVAWCRENDITCIVSDITPFAFDVARELGINSIAVSNFTWFDIYAEYVNTFPQFSPFLDEIYKQYQSAGMLLALQPALQMEYFSRKEPVPVVGRKGKNVREKLMEEFGFSTQKKVGLIYVGDFGMNDTSWEKLVQFTGWEFLGLYAFPNSPPNYHQVNKSAFRYQDLTASVDVVVSKIGYGVVSECFLNGTPLIYLPRESFAEYPIMEKAVQSWGGGICLPRCQFSNLDWGDALAGAAEKALVPLRSDGAHLCAEAIGRIARQG